MRLIISGANDQNSPEGKYFRLDDWSGGSSRVCVCVCVCVYSCVCLCNFAFVCIVFVSRGKHSRETPAVVMPAVTSSYSACNYAITSFKVVFII